jgi:deoxyadenosine/deoxycytidine kinase
MTIITVDGLIGAGKSTAMVALSRMADVVIDLEQVDKWAPYLKELYHDNNNAFEFQMRVWLDRCWPADNAKTTIVERSPLFQSEVFIDIMEEEKSVTNRQAGLLREVYKHTMSAWKPTKMIYLRADPDKCMGRIRHRSRDGEEGISLAYLQRMHELHEGVYARFGESDNVVVIDVEGKTPEQIASEIAAVCVFIS